jgi:cholesterol oxidase
MMEAYGAAVIGTGFGGSVAACRLAQAGCRVAVLERGRRYEQGSYPRNWNDLDDGWLWRQQQGLFDVRLFHDMTVVQSAGYGGGSLIYANVHLRPPADVFEEGWPEGYTRAVLDPYFDLVAYMLDVTPIREQQPLGLPPKTRAMKQVAAELGREGQFCYPPLAVHFGDPTLPPAPNKFGVLQSGCDHCGECDIGCNRHAKNTLDLNYLAVAEKTGNAELHLRCEVIRIEPAGTRYRVHYFDHAADLEKTLEAEAVFVCAGAINSTELLLRCRDQYRTLPDLSPALGHRYSANGDYIGFAFDTRMSLRPTVGPTITTGIVYDDADRADRTWFIWEEGGHPRQISRLLQLLNPRRQWLEEATRLLHQEVRDEIRRSARETIGMNGPLVGDDSAVFLAMGRDRADGRLELLPVTSALHLTWNLPANWGLYSIEERFSADVAQAMGGVLGFNPLWKRFRQPVAVHNLGGCPMSDDPLQGVTNRHGEVHGYPNLFVLDGAILPSATGVNPSSTIAAVAERNIEEFIRRRLGVPDWQAPERGKAPTLDDPLTHITIPEGGTPPPRTQAIGVRFTERMVGHISRGHVPADDYLGAVRAGRAAGTVVDFTLTITMPDVPSFLADRTHPGIAVGRVRVDGFTPPDGAPVTSGVFNLFVPTDSVFAREMLYALPFFGVDGRPYLLDGYKDVRDHGAFDVWPATSTLYTVIREGHERSGRVLATGMVRIRTTDFARQLTTIRTTGGGSPLSRAGALARFGRFFVGSLFDVFARPRFE